MPTTVPRDRIESLWDREIDRFRRLRPRTAELARRARAVMPKSVPMSWLADTPDFPLIFAATGEGTWFTDVDGHRYLDMNQADMSMNCGYGPPAVVRAAAERVRQGSQFLLPTEDSIAVAEELARRWGLPKWQFTLSASSANAELIRVARYVTGRSRIVMFDGAYHGHVDDTLVKLVNGRVRPELHGLPERVTDETRIVPFNDLAALERALAPKDVACVLAEPAPTNCGVILPEPGFLRGVRELTESVGTLLFLDEAHTQVCSAGGLKAAWSIACDGVGLGKCLGGGVPLGAWGVTEAIAARIEGAPPGEGGPTPAGVGVATGGTFFGNALGMATARAALERILVPEAYERAGRLGARLADGLDAAFAASGLAWTAQRLMSRSGYTFAPRLPRNAAEARAFDDPALRALVRVHLANRGVWEAIVSAGPAVSFAANEADVEVYLGVFRELLADLVA
jgi:glutamate-1-semialdehyde aminotransferase